MAKMQQLVGVLKVWIDEWAQVKGGEDVLVVADTKTDQTVLDLVVMLATERGARVTTCIAPPMPVASGAMEGSHIGEKYAPLPKPLFEAVKAADRVLTLGGTSGHNLYWHILNYEYKAPTIPLGPGASDPDWLLSEASRFPRELLRQIDLKFSRIVQEGKLFRLTHPVGTDLTFTALPGNWTSIDNIPPYPAPSKVMFVWHPLGRGATGANPPETADGIVVSPYCKDLGGALKEPVKFTFIDGWCTVVEGGSEAEKIKQLIGDDPNNRRIEEIEHGLNPKMSAYTSGGQVTYSGSGGAGNVHLSIGREEGRYASSEHITIAFLTKVTFYVDGKLLINKGRNMVLDDPEIREIAKKYGKPDKLLSQVDL